MADGRHRHIGPKGLFSYSISPELYLYRVSWMQDLHGNVRELSKCFIDAFDEHSLAQHVFHLQQVTNLGICISGLCFIHCILKKASALNIFSDAIGINKH